jgi:hypothetical protein
VWLSRTRTLLDRLERQAAASGIRRMVADTLVINKGKIQFATRAGYIVEVSCGDASVARLEKCLTGSLPILIRS